MKSIRQYLKKLPFIANFLSNKNRPITGLNNSIINRGKFNNVVLDIIGNNNEIRIGKNTSVNNALIFIRGDYHTLIIEDNCFFGKGEFWIEDNHCSLIIHNRTTIEQAHLAVTEPHSILEIHEDCMLAKHVEIRTGDSHSIIDLDSGERINYAANVTLEDHVWVGAHAIILKGVTIGNNSVIGTGSIVNKNVPPNSIAAGVPAKVLKNGIDWKRERLYK